MIHLSWWKELQHRWPLIVGILRGKTVIYAAQIGPPKEALVVINNSNGAVVMDSLFIAGKSKTAIKMKKA